MKTDDFRVDFFKSDDNVTVPAYRLDRLLKDAEKLKIERDEAVKSNNETLILNEWLRSKLETLKNEKLLHVELEKYA